MIRFIGPRAEALKDLGSASKAALKCPTSWISLVARCSLLVVGCTFILHWFHFNEHLSINRSLLDVLSSPLFIGFLLWFGAFGRAIADHEFSLREFWQALIHQLVVVPTSLALWFVFGAILHCIGYESFSHIVFPFATFAYCYRAASFETDRILAKLPFTAKPYQTESRAKEEWI